MPAVTLALVEAVVAPASPKTSHQEAERRNCLPRVPSRWPSYRPSRFDPTAPARRPDRHRKARLPPDPRQARRQASRPDVCPSWAGRCRSSVALQGLPAARKCLRCRRRRRRLPGVCRSARWDAGRRRWDRRASGRRLLHRSRRGSPPCLPAWARAHGRRGEQRLPAANKGRKGRSRFSPLLKGGSKQRSRIPRLTSRGCSCTR